MTLRRILALIALMASLIVGGASAADAGEVCVRYKPFDSLGLDDVRACAPTNV